MQVDLYSEAGLGELKNEIDILEDDLIKICKANLAQLKWIEHFFYTEGVSGSSPDVRI